MEKLIKLLNEYLKTKDTEIHRTPKVFAFEKATKSFIAENGISYRQERVISKRFKFIQRLVDNDKIDYYLIGKKGRPCLGFYRDYEILLIILSISETPIEDLISYLK